MKHFFTASILLFTATASFAQSPKLVEAVTKKGTDLVIPYQKYKLSNGLTVILTEDHSDPIVHVDVTYHVGSAREEIGKSGFAHFFEHMMFEGSDHVKSGDHFKIVSNSGGDLNGSTNNDRTNYYETAPSNQLEKMLWLESDRMGFLLDAVTQKKFEIQRSTVKNERGQNYDNRPYGLANETVSRVLYPYGHPYSWLTIGYVEDLNSVNVNDLKRFFLRWYGPNNATLTIGGDINVKQTLAWVQKYFGDIPSGPTVAPTILPAPVLNADKYISYTDNYARQPLLYMVFPGVKMYDKDMAALDALSMIIGGGENSLLYKNFIKTAKAGSVAMFSNNQELAGTIGVQVLPFAGLTLNDARKMVKLTFEEFEKRGVTDEDLAMFKGSSEAAAIGALSSISGKVSELAAAQTFTGSPNQIGKELAKIRRVTKADVIRVYNQYIKGKACVTLSILPKNAELKPAGEDNFVMDKSKYKAPDYGYNGLTYKKAQDVFDRGAEPGSGANPVVKVPPHWKASTANGIQIIGSSNNEIPTVSLTLSFKGGGQMAAKDPAKAGLPNIVAAMLNEDTKILSKEQISSKLDVLGSRIRVSASGTNISFNVYSLKKNLDQTLDILQQRLFSPKFTQQSLDRIKKQTIQNLQNAKTQPANIASTVFNKLLFGKDNIRTYGLSGTEETVNQITLADVQSFYNNYFAPNIANIVIVGDLTETSAKAKLAFLSSWKTKKVEIPDSPQPTEAPQTKTIYIVDVPRAAQSEIRFGYYTGVNYDATGVFYRMTAANYALGGAFNSRLNMDLREEKGWTYGASSNFSGNKFDGTFTAGAGVRAAATDSAAMEFVKEIRNYAKDGIEPAELTFTKSSIGQSDALNYETNEQKAAFLYRIQEYNLSSDFVAKQIDILNKLTKAEVDELAKKYLDVDKMTMLIVGDKSSFLPGLKDSGYTIIELDADGKIK